MIHKNQPKYLFHLKFIFIYHEESLLNFGLKAFQSLQENILLLYYKSIISKVSLNILSLLSRSSQQKLKIFLSLTQSFYSHLFSILKKG